MRIAIIIFSTIAILSCNRIENSSQKQVIPGSAKYKPLTREEENSLKKADRTILPFDVKRDIKNTEKKSVIWTGIVDTVVYFNPSDTVMIVDVYLQHRYYDFIEDFSIQQERMFVSPIGEGNYIFRQAIIGKRPFDKIKDDLNKSIFKECFIFSYGIVSSLKDSVPVLIAENIRIVFPENYATNILSYKAERDKNNKIVLTEGGHLNFTDFQRIKVAEAGRNQFGSRLANSKD
jgi:hypothetical protein